MPLGHRLQPRHRLWPLTLAALMLWGFVIWMPTAKKTGSSSEAHIARRVMENSVLAYDAVLRSGRVHGWWKKLISDDSMDTVLGLSQSLEKRSLMTDGLRTDFALVFHHFAQTTGDEVWDERALALQGKIKDGNARQYLSQVAAALHSQSLSAESRAELETQYKKWPQDWWPAQLAHLYGMDGLADQKGIRARELRAEIQAIAGWIVAWLLCLCGVVLAIPTWKVLRDAASFVRWRSDRFRRLRRLWAPALVLLCVALVGLVEPASGMAIGFIPDKVFAPFRHGWLWWPFAVLLFGCSAFLIMVEPLGLRWCLARGTGGLRRLFDLRVSDFRDRRWWLMGIAGSGLLYAAFWGLGWGLEKLGIKDDEFNDLRNSFSSLGAFALPFTLILTVVVGPFIEELVYRGFLFTAFRNQYGFWVGAVVSSALFSWKHFYGWFGTVDVFVYGLVFCYLYQRTGRLAASMILHACINLPLTILTWLEWSA